MKLQKFVEVIRKNPIKVTLIFPSDIHIWCPFWTLKISGNQVQRPSGTLLKERGSSNLVQNMGHKGPVLRPRYISPGRS
jgi:hypothetical protein